MYKKFGILTIAVTLLLLGTGTSIVLAKMPVNYSTNPDVLKIEINQSGQFYIILVYHDLKAGYWDIGFTGKQRAYSYLKNISYNDIKGSISFPDSQINQFVIPT